MIILRKVFDEELLEIHDLLLKIGSVAEKQIFLSVEALVKQDSNMAEEVIKSDDIVDDLQKELENKCVKLLAKQQPLATDLRKIFSTSKIASDLERVADYAVDIARIAIRLKNETYIKELVDIPRIADIAKEMIKGSLDAYVEGSVENAYAVCKMDDEIDNLYRQVSNELLNVMRKDSTTILQATQFLFICKFLERIGDHITNVCEYTIYLVTGEQVDLND